MRVLGLETSSSRASVALLDGEKVLAQIQSEAVGAHAEHLLPMLQEVLRQAELERSWIERVAVGVGPGSFTGVRVSLSAGRGLARGLGIPIVGVGALQAMAAAHIGSTAVVPVLDARRDEVFVAAYTAQGEQLIAAQAVKVSEFDAWIGAQLSAEHVFVGAGAALVGREVASAHPACALPHAEFVAKVAARLDPVSATATPIYVRDAGATPQRLPISPF